MLASSVDSGSARPRRYVMHETYESPKDATSSFAVAEKDPETRPGLRSFENADDYTGMVGNVTVPIDNRMTLFGVGSMEM